MVQINIYTFSIAQILNMHLYCNKVELFLQSDGFCIIKRLCSALI